MSAGVGSATDEIALREVLCEAGRRLYARNLVAATDGNLSARLGPDRFLCTPSGVSKGYMTPDSLLLVDGAGEKLAGEGRVSSELHTHLTAYHHRPDIGAVVHAHPPIATALSLAGIGMTLPLLPEVVLAFGGIPTAAYATPGSREGGEVIRGLIQQTDALLLDRHGALTVGEGVLDAYHKMEKVEHAAQIVFFARLLGEPKPLGPDAVARALALRAAYGVKGPAYPVD